MSHHQRILLPAILLALGFGSSLPAQDTVDFGRRIRPLLADKCFACHGPDQEHREGELRLDTRDGLFGKGESGADAVVPGKPDESSLYLRLVTKEEGELMPPADSDKKMTADEIAMIRKWIEQGAKWQQHWSLVAPVRPAVPTPANAAWAKNDIDRFVLSTLEKEGLQPSPLADKVALLRRVTLDLTGLPPTPAEVDAFLADPSPGAFEGVVDRLLKSPHYGEHFARFWLDAARYGDTHGLHLDNFRMMWPYRDWVIRAFNDNMPFDRFTVEQLAGDLLPNATQDQIIATGFNRCNVTTSEGGAIPEEYEVYYTNDRVATMSTVWLATSMGCVTCHENKFDPYEMKDFYQLYAFFNSIDGPAMDGNSEDTAPVIRVSTESQRSEMAKLDQKIADLAAAMKAARPEVDQAQAAWEEKVSRNLKAKVEWTMLAPETFTSAGGATLSKQEDGSWLVAGNNPDKEVYELIAQVPAEKLTAIKLEGLTHPSLTEGGAGRSGNSNVVLTEFEVEAAPASASTGDIPWQRVKLTKAWADHEQKNGDFKVTNAIDGKSDTGWAIEGHARKENRTAIFLAESVFGHPGGTKLRIRIKHESVYAKHQFGRLRLSVTPADTIPEIGGEQAPAEIVKLLEIEPAKRSAEQIEQLKTHYREKVTTDEALVKTRDELANIKKQRTDLENSLPTSLVWRDKKDPKPAFVLLRGAYDKPGERVYRNTPAVLPPLGQLAKDEVPTRLHLAKWLLTPEQPLTARVIVNRYWQQYFGVGIVETSEDFGTQGTPPSHPELLDWLAVDFRENGWDVKRMQKLIVMSATYQQSSKMTPELAKRDPRNRLLARGPRFRMEAEMIRDTALAASGSLLDKLGGPSVKPYQPSGIWEAVGYTDSNTANFTRDQGEALYRRSLYTFWKRTAPPPTMVNFDAPSRENCSVRRSRTNTPLAALALMNDEQYVEASRKMAERVLKEGGESEQQKGTYAFRLATARLPSDKELAVLLEVLHASQQRFQADVEAAKKLNAVGESKPDEKLDPSQVAAWSLVTNLVLNLDETITK